MPRCKNCPPPPHKGHYYTGKENTPRGKGYCARFEKEGKKMKGTDGKMYRAVKGKWTKNKPSESARTNPRGFFDRNRSFSTDEITFEKIQSVFNGETSYRYTDNITGMVYVIDGKNQEYTFSTINIGDYREDNLESKYKILGEDYDRLVDFKKEVGDQLNYEEGFMLDKIASSLKQAQVYIAMLLIPQGEEDYSKQGYNRF